MVGIGVGVWRWGLVAVAVAMAMAVALANAAELTAAECKAEKNLAVKECMAVVFGRMPSPACCERVRVSHMECICPTITSKLFTFVDPNRVIRLVEGCGRKVPRHFKCGSLTTP